MLSKDDFILKLNGSKNNFPENVNLSFPIKEFFDEIFIKLSFIS